MGALQTWLSNITLPRFQECYLGREPLAGMQSAVTDIDLCTWTELAAWLAGPAEDVLVVAGSRLLPSAPPRSQLELQQMFARGIGIALRSAQRCSARLAGWCRAFAEDLPGEQRVIVFATPAGTNGFGWHYDAEDVFVLQTYGDKEYFFRRNTVARTPACGAQPDFSVYREETSPMLSCRLLPGDWLYLPRGFWHVAHANTDSLSVSVGVFPAQQRQP